MSLTIQMPSPRFGGTSEMTRDGLCRSWLLREDFSASSLAGTTFPPFTHRLQGMKRTTSNLLQNDKAKFASEPDLTFTGEDGRHNEEHNEDDDDYLFEFDVGSPTSEDDDYIRHKNKEPDYNEDDAIKAMQMIGRRLSNSSQGSTSSVHINDSKNVGFQSIFGKKISIASSGIGSERTSLQEDEHLFVQEEHNQTILPANWKQSYNNFIQLSSSNSEDGTITGSYATSIVASSPAEDSPIVSPDSLLDSYHIEDEHTMFYLQNDEDDVNDDKKLTEDKVKTIDTKLNFKKGLKVSLSNEKLDNISEEVDIEVKASSGESTPCEGSFIEDDIIITTGDTKHHVAKSKLTSLISQLETDREYSKVKEMGDSGIDISSRKSSLDSTEERPLLRKTSSLKTMRTPPGTMRKKKNSVRFADVLGLDLQNVKMFRDEIPRIPKCAFRDLNVDLSEFDFGSPKSPVKTSYIPPTRAVSHQTMVPMFTQPGATPHFNEIVRNRKVCLENAYMTEGDAIMGTIKVYNLDFNKTVTVRWTKDEWKSSRDEKCIYVQGSSDSVTDKFSFRLTVGQLPVGSRFQFCIRFTCAGHDHWDNNSGGNYVFQVFKSSGSAPIASPIAIQSQPSRNTQYSSFGFLHMPRASPGSQSHSPSHHGDDPWLRYI